MRNDDLNILFIILAGLLLIIHFLGWVVLITTYFILLYQKNWQIVTIFWVIGQSRSAGFNYWVIPHPIYSIVLTFSSVFTGYFNEAISLDNIYSESSDSEEDNNIEIKQEHEGKLFTRVLIINYSLNLLIWFGIQMGNNNFHESNIGTFSLLILYVALLFAMYLIGSSLARSEFNNRIKKISILFLFVFMIIIYTVLFFFIQWIIFYGIVRQI